MYERSRVKEKIELLFCWRLSAILKNARWQWNILIPLEIICCDVIVFVKYSDSISFHTSSETSVFRWLIFFSGRVTGGQKKKKEKGKKEITDTCGQDLWQPINNIYTSIQIAVAILLQGEQTYWKLGAFLLRRTRTKYWSSASASRGNFPYVTSRTCQIQDLAQLSFFCRYRFLHCSYRNVTPNM